MIEPEEIEWRPTGQGSWKGRNKCLDTLHVNVTVSHAGFSVNGIIGAAFNLDEAKEEAIKILLGWGLPIKQKDPTT